MWSAFSHILQESQRDLVAKSFREKMIFFWYDVVEAFDKLLKNLPFYDSIPVDAQWVLIGLIVLLPIVIALVVWRVLIKQKPKVKFPSKPQTPGEAVKAAKEAAKMGNYLTAGEFFEKGEKYDKAIDAFMRVNAFTRVADIYAKRLNQLDKALEILTHNSLWEKAGELMAIQGQFGDAAHYFEKAGKSQAAAEAFGAGFMRPRAVTPRWGPGSRRPRSTRPCSGSTGKRCRRALARTSTPSSTSWPSRRLTITRRGATSSAPPRS